MNIEACVKKIDKYLNKETAQPLIVDVQTADELSSVVEHYNVGENKFLYLRDYCNKDEIPRIDDLLYELINETGAVFVIGLGTFLKLRGEKFLRDTLRSVLSLNTKGHIIVITYRCRTFLEFHDPRLKDRIFVFNTEVTSKTAVTFISNKGVLPTDRNYVDGINNIAEKYESSDDECIYVKTKKQKKSFPLSLIEILDLSDSYSILCTWDFSANQLSKSLGCEEQWEYVLKKFEKHNSLIEIVDAEFGNHSALELALCNYEFFEPDKKWFYFVALKLFGSKNNCVLNMAAKASSHDMFIRQIYRDVLNFEPHDKEYVNYYDERKLVLRQLNNPREEVVDFCRLVVTKGRDAIYYLTDNTPEEKEKIIELLDRYGADYGSRELNSILKMVYLDLHMYLSKYMFEWSLLNSYFEQYKVQKVINKIYPVFFEIVLEQAQKREYGRFLPSRASVVEKIDCLNAQVYFVDALGAEYLGYIVSLCAEKKLECKAQVCSCELPSITSQNKDFESVLSDIEHEIISVKDIDEIKHHGTGNYDYQVTKLPLYVIKELEIIRDLISKIHEKLTNGVIDKAVIVSDHGSSRLAVIKESETVIQMEEKGEHSGRCCYKSEVDVQPECAVDAGEFWALANYDRFKGGRKANVEVHGGATIEEVTVPVIEISKKKKSIEFEMLDKVIFVSYRKKAEMRLYSNSNIDNVSVLVDGEFFEAHKMANNVYLICMPSLKKAGEYKFDVYRSGVPVQTGLSFTIKKEGTQENSIL